MTEAIKDAIGLRDILLKPYYSEEKYNESVMWDYFDDHIADKYKAITVNATHLDTCKKLSIISYLRCKDNKNIHMGYIHGMRVITDNSKDNPIGIILHKTLAPLEQDIYPKEDNEGKRTWATQEEYEIIFNKHFHILYHDFSRPDILGIEVD